jgi:hypothetical protein
MLQNASYKTNIWYEKRRDEFREVPKNITKVPNYIFANVYLAYHLQAPVSVLNSYEHLVQTNGNEDLNFISHREHKDGLYEKIFNEETQFEDMLCAYYIFDVVVKNMFSYKRFQSGLYYLLTLFKVAFTKYLQAKFEDTINVNNYIIKIYENGEIEIILKTFNFLREFLGKFVRDSIEITDNDEKTAENIVKFLFEPVRYEKIKEELENMEISVNQIEDLVLSNEDKQEAKEIYEKSDEE